MKSNRWRLQNPETMMPNLKPIAQALDCNRLSSLGFHGCQSNHSPTHRFWLWALKHDLWLL